MENPVHKSRASGGRLVRRTFVVALILVGASLIVGGTVEFYLRYRSSVENIWMLILLKRKP